jgi:tetratricopeptide (TPR) repeat protein/predicted Ser/Thr protein kinase
MPEVPPSRAADSTVDTESRVGNAIAQARPDDTASALLARAKVAGALFGPEAASGPGRFRILGRLGAGGMGVVYAAYDPDLDRGVALKLVQVPAGDRDAALAEAKALARLSHPNVVPIYDAGISDGHVYLVMELVRGKTLRGWARGRPRHEVLDAYQQAGAALVAAHRAGLVHRDFKPENAIVGGDGRVRVVDFGLACEVEDPAAVGAREGRLAGTPRYMPPEQARGAAITPKADQYSFCVALDEALAEALDPPTPRWLAAVIERGRAADPGARFESMSQLVKALGRDPGRRRRRWASVATLAAATAAVAFVAGRRQAGVSEPEACTGAQHELAGAWKADARAAALTRLDGLGAYGRAVRSMIDARLDDHAVRWARESRAACLDHRRGAQSDTLFDLRTACLARGLAAWTTVGDIIGTVDASQLAEVPRSVQALPDPAACSDIAALVTGAPPPPAAIAPQVRALTRRIEQARVQLVAGRFADAHAAASSAVAEARALRHVPVLAEALLVEGHATMATRMRAAEPILAEAQDLAISVNADALAVEAWARRAFVLGTSTDAAGALAGLDVVAALAKRTTTGGFARALLYNNVGSVELAREHRDRARIAFETALDHARGVTGAGALELVNARANLALVTDDRDHAGELLREAAGDLSAWLGGDHPSTLELRWLHAGMTDETTVAAAILDLVCQGYELHPGLAVRAATCWGELGFLALELDDRGRAIAALERATRPQAGPARPQDTGYTGYLALARGDASSAITRFRDAIEALQRVRHNGWWDDLTRGELHLGLGRAQRAIGAPRDARRTLEASIADLVEVVRNHPTADYERRLRRARAELALTVDAIAGPGQRPK